MRVSQATRERTRAALLAAGAELFAERGLGRTTTRELAVRAGIAVGTLFNYFPSKEALALELVRLATDEAQRTFEAERRSEAGLEETLFGLIACHLRFLRPHRAWVREVLEGLRGPLLGGPNDDGPRRLAAQHLELVDARIAAAGVAAGGERDLTLHIYWTLYLGVLDFWSRDESEHQGASLAFLDRSMDLFCRALPEQAAQPFAGKHDGRQATDAG